MRAVLILFDILKLNKEDLCDSLVIGVDRGAYNAISFGIKPDISIGDFDSVNDEEFKEIAKNSKSVIKLNPIKDKTDTEEAINLVKGYDEIVILGGIQGKRIEHFYANLMLLLKYPNVKIKDDRSLIEVKDKSFIPNKDYKFISLFSIDEEAIISISGMKYNLENYHLKKIDATLGCSNEIINNPIVNIHSGRLLVISSKDDEKL